MSKISEKLWVWGHLEGSHNGLTGLDCRMSPEEFADFIGANMRVDAVNIADEESISDIMEFYMGDNTIERQNFIRQNLRSEAELEDINI